MASNPSTNIRRVKPAELARELGVSRQAIHDLISRNVLSKDAEGLIDIEMAKIALTNRVRPSGKTAAAISRPPAPAGLPAPAPPPPDSQPDAHAATSFHVARTLRESEEARMAKIKRMQLEDTLTEAAPAADAVFQAFRLLRDTLMPLGRRVAARVATMTDPHEIQLLVDEEMRKALSSFHDKTLASLTSRINPQPPAATPAESPTP